MTCALPTPQWLGSSEGLLSATQNVVDGYIVLTIAEAEPTIQGAAIHYTIFHGDDISSLYDGPRLLATETQVSVPPSLISLEDYIHVRAAQLGVSSSIDGYMEKVGDNLYLFPSATLFTETVRHGNIADGYTLVVENAVGFPSDGYISVGGAVIRYSNILFDYTMDGYDGIVVSDPDPYGCNGFDLAPDGYFYVFDEVSLFRGFEVESAARFRANARCSMPVPTWPGEIGIKLAEDFGIGTAVQVTTYDARVPPGFSPRYFNWYIGSSLLGLIQSRPVGWSAATSVVFPDTVPGHIRYYATKAMYQLDALPVGGWDQLSSGFYAYPATTTIDSIDGYLFSGVLGTVDVASTDGFPISGYIRINSEVLSYSGLTQTSFNISQRDLFSIGLSVDYPNGTEITFFKGVEDGNRNYFGVTSTWDASNSVPNLPLPDGYNGYPTDGYGGASYNQDLDGYRAYATDDINEDYSSFEEERADDVLTGRCSYHRENWDDLYSRNQCGTYSGGQIRRVIPGVNGGNPVSVGGGIDVWGHATRTEEDLLGKTGTPFVLLRRKWTGRKCPILSLRSEHPHARCLTCYGTTFDGGYDRYLNPRQVKMGAENPHGFIMVRVDPYVNDIELSQSEGLRQIDTVSAWTISIPTLKDRDILIRYYYDIETGDYQEEFRYEVMNVGRNTLLWGQMGKQSLSLRKLDRTREIYKYPDPTPPLSGVPVPPGWSA